MSRIGNKKITLPAKVKVSVSESGSVTVEGPRRKLVWVLPAPIKAKVEGTEVALTRPGDSRQEKALHG
ncbi:MAG: 50S ribosomal protein L6, partial [Verrucomicrobia bacterium]|nr:50S ribosomal protein L6 [Verrucomicrobiota bacterium]